MKRESFGSRLGFILISAGCAIGLGNVWRFPYIVGKYGGAAFILIYVAFLLIFGLPIMAMEFSVGRASKKSIATSFNELEPKGTKWHWFSIFGMAGNYLLVMFYTTVTGWMLAYFFKMLRGDFASIGETAAEAQPLINAQFGELVSSPVALTVLMTIIVVAGFLVCSLGLQNGVEKITKVMMIALLAIISILAVRSVTLPEAGTIEGIKYYLVPDFGKMAENGIGEVIFAALGQAFFTLSIGMGSIAIFGSYISRDRRLLGESVTIAVLDTFVAFMAGLIVIPACFAFGVHPGEGSSLVFKTLPYVFESMPGGTRVWGSLFFLFMLFAAFSTVIGVFENIVSFQMDLKGWSRRKSSIVNMIAIIILSMPCVLGFNVLSGFEPLGAGSVILDLEDFIISNNILPLGSAVYVLFCTSKKGWGYDNFMEEVNAGSGMRFPKWLGLYSKYILPIALIIFWAQGIISKIISIVNG